MFKSSTFFMFHLFQLKELKGGPFIQCLLLFDGRLFIVLTSVIVAFFVPQHRSEKGPIKWPPFVVPSFRLSVRPSVRLLPRYLQIASVYFYGFLREVATFANSERNILRFFEKMRKRGKMGVKMTLFGSKKMKKIKKIWKNQKNN